jgi:ribosomal protein S18 acetylase RimI-like enzyme
MAEQLHHEPGSRYQGVSPELIRRPVLQYERVAQQASRPPRTADVVDAGIVAGLLDAFNKEYDTPTPGVAVLAARLELLLRGGDVLALLAGEPALAVAVVTLRPNVWYDGPVALLDELYVAPEFRGQGIGSALLAGVETLAQERGAELVEINVDGNDVRARRFYERHGYANCEPGDNQPLLYYYRPLNAAGA